VTIPNKYYFLLYYYVPKTTDVLYESDIMLFYNF